MTLGWRAFLASALFSVTVAGHGQNQPALHSSLAYTTKIKVKNKIETVLNDFCPEACEIVGVDVNVSEELPPETIDDLGFEESEAGITPVLKIKEVKVSIQIDKQVTKQNRDRLNFIITNHVGDFDVPVTVEWVPLDVPRIRGGDSATQILKKSADSKIRIRLEEIISRYCPDSCLLSAVRIEGSSVTPDEASTFPHREVVQSSDGVNSLHLTAVDIEVLIDQNMTLAKQDQVERLMRAAVGFVQPVTLKTTKIVFPETYQNERLRAEQESADPYGLEKLRRMLIMFRDLAGTKEVISKSEKLEERAEVTESETSSSDRFSATGGNLWLWVILLMLAAGGIAWFLIRYGRARDDSNALVAAYQDQRLQAGEPKESKKDEVARRTLSPAQAQLHTRVNLLKSELIDIFIKEPKVAKETFAKMIQEDGLEATAKYVHIFGKMVVIELFSDTTLHRRLHELCDVYDNMNLNISLEDQEKLLLGLKQTVTANQIRVLARVSTDQFQFLRRMDPQQIHHLIREENPKMQAIVMTQLPPDGRRTVFDAFDGDSRQALLLELCKAEAIPKEYLANVARALEKKITTRPEFDTQNLRSTDILLDIMESSSLAEQKDLMTSLVEVNPEAARTIKLKLVSLEMVPFMKEGHLLELILGLEHQDLVLFLAGAPEHISRLLLSRAPEELAQSWREELSHTAGVETAQYRLVELKILGKIRSLAASGAVNILDINEMLFKPEAYEERPVLENNEAIVA